MPQISIITPVYNTEKYLIKCLDSIKKQTFSDFDELAEEISLALFCLLADCTLNPLLFLCCFTHSF